MRPILVVLLIAAAPQAGAYVNVCWGLVGACAYSNAWQTGGGDCDEGASDHYRFRTLRASWQHANVTRTVEVRNDCDAHARESASWQGSSLRAHYTSYDAGSREYSWIWFDWSGQDHSANGASCSDRLWRHNTEPLPEGTTEPGCPAGRPPFALLELP